MDVVTVQQRTVVQVIDVSPEEPREESAPQSRSVEQVVDELDDEGTLVPQPSALAGLDGAPLDVTSRVAAKTAPYKGNFERAVRLELERVRFEKEAQRRYLRARARSHHRARYENNSRTMQELIALAVSGMVDVSESDVAVSVEGKLPSMPEVEGAACGIECLLMKRWLIDGRGSQSSTSLCGLVHGTQ